MAFCPRHKREVDIFASHATHEQDPETGAVHGVTYHELECGEALTLPSGRPIFDRCRFTAEAMREGKAAWRAEQAAEAEQADDEVAVARAKKGKTDGK